MHLANEYGFIEKFLLRSLHKKLALIQSERIKVTYQECGKGTHSAAGHLRVTTVAQDHLNDSLGHRPEVISPPLLEVSKGFNDWKHTGACSLEHENSLKRSVCLLDECLTTQMNNEMNYWRGAKKNRRGDKIS
ncbi:hypothetical protein ILUMI_24310 [Ignelater luminosus]|uniref:Uncharacterized protein n=1 Tax=Ignelater luminosus TaxID=2038154 RepID=A0A8K0CDP0_IGNLU|nr:hypothetical protein ILUMI_24310 [Ignelater luminosus]